MRIHFTTTSGYLLVRSITSTADATTHTVTCRLAQWAQQSVCPSQTPSQLLVALRKGVGVRVVDEGVVAVAPREGLVSDAEVAVGEELWLSVLLNVLRVFLLLAVGVVRHKKTRWDSNKERNSLPKGKGAQSMAFLLFDSLFEGGKATKSAPQSKGSVEQRRHFVL